MCNLWPLLHRIGSHTPGDRVGTFTLVTCLSDEVTEDSNLPNPSLTVK
jgi:hypothetical protein